MNVQKITKAVFNLGTHEKETRDKISFAMAHSKEQGEEIIIQLIKSLLLEAYEMGVESANHKPAKETSTFDLAGTITTLTTDLATLPDNERLKLIADYIEKNPQQIIGVAVEASNKKKRNRYISKVMDKATNSLVHELETIGKVTIIKFRHKQYKEGS